MHGAWPRVTLPTSDHEEVLMPGHTLLDETHRGDGWRLAPTDRPDARRAENRGRLLLVVSYVLCPCHLPVTMTLLGAAFGGTAAGAYLTADAWRLGILLGLAYALVLWRAFRHLRRAKALAGGGPIVCTPDGCT
jgi:hypothetical protein